MAKGLKNPREEGSCWLRFFLGFFFLSKETKDSADEEEDVRGKNANNDHDDVRSVLDTAFLEGKGCDDRDNEVNRTENGDNDACNNHALSKHPDVFNGDVNVLGLSISLLHDFLRVLDREVANSDDDGSDEDGDYGKDCANDVKNSTSSFHICFLSSVIVVQKDLSLMGLLYLFMGVGIPP